MIALSDTRRLVARLLILPGAMLPGHAAAECQMVKLGTLPVEFSYGSLVTHGTLNGNDIEILVDTGASDSTIWMAAAERAGLTPVRDKRYRAAGLSGQTDMYKVNIDELYLGDFAIRDRTWPVIGGDPISENLGMILGSDFWSKVDVEFDLANDEVIAWEPRDCGKTALGYWNKDFMMARLEDGPGNDVHTKVLLNGKEVNAIIDSGANVTLMDSTAARRIGFRPDPDSADAAQVAGIGDKGALDSFVAIFDTFAMGELTIKNAKIRVMEMNRYLRTTRVGSRFEDDVIELPDLIIGTDFLRANRVLIANSQGYIYMTYNGGRVFQTEVPELTFVNDGTADAESSDRMESALEKALAGGDYADLRALPQDIQQAYHDGSVALHEKRYADAEASMRALEALLEREGVRNDMLGIAVLNTLLMALDRQDKGVEAIAIYERLQPLIEKQYGPDNAFLAYPMTIAASHYIKDRKYAEAERLLLRAQGIAEREPGGDNVLLTAVLDQLGTAQEGAGRYAEAEATFRRCLETVQQTGGADDQAAAIAMVNIGRIAETREDFAEAHQQYTHAREISASRLGADHEQVKFIDSLVKNVEERRAAESD